MRTLIILFISVLLAGGDDDDLLLDHPYEFKQPEHFPAPVYDLERNPITGAGFLLGKKLFNDPRLSSDRSVACSSCHAQAVAFADPQHRFSQGVDGRFGNRNAPQMANLAFMREFFWDGGVADLDFVPINAIEHPDEMGSSLADVVAFLQTDAEYPALFNTAFSVDTITSALVLQAFAQFTNLLISDRSKYDDVVLNRNDAAFTAIELRGEQLFNQHCANCHQPPLFTNQGFANNGLDAEFTDEGRAGISGNPLDIGKFRIPSLRNVTRTSPYMHDGRFDSLEEVLDHYSAGITNSPTLASELSNGIDLTPEEKIAIIEFLGTLTDYEFIRDQRF